MVSRLSIASIILTTGAFAQMSSFPKPDYFRQAFGRSNTKVELRAVSLKDSVADGKLKLSLKDYLELVMANNTDVQVTFLSVETPRNNITLAHGGPNGSWDPSATASFATTRSTTSATNPAQATNATLGSITKNLSQPFSMGVTQGLDIGGNYQVTFGGTKVSSNNSRSSYNPSITSNMSFAYTQSLIRNRGRYVNRIPIMQAESRYKQAGFTLRAQLLTLVNAAESAYWSVISAREYVRVQERARDTSKANMDFVQQQLDLGAVSPLDIFNPQGQLAAAELSLSQARFNLLQAENNLRRQMGADLDPTVRNLPIELTEPVDTSITGMDLDPESKVQKALENSPTVKANMQALETDDLSIYSANNSLKPQLNVTVSYAGSGQGGIYNSSTSTLLGSTTPLLVPGGLSDALGQMFGLDRPTYQGSINLTLPIRSRVAAMNLANSLVSKKANALALRNVQQSTRVSVLNALNNVNGAIASLRLARIQEDLQHKNYDAEVQKYQLGTDINQNVVIALQSWVVAQASVLTAQVNLRTSITNLYTQTGELLDERGIVVK